MDFLNTHLLSLILFLPTIAALVILLLLLFPPSCHVVLVLGYNLL